MLGSCLTGIALGGAIAAPIARRSERAAVGFVVAEVAVGVLGLLAFLVADRLPDLAAALGVAGPQDLARSAGVSTVVLVPLATAIGATFPFAVRIAAHDAADAAAMRAAAARTGALGSSSPSKSHAAARASCWPELSAIQQSANGWATAWNSPMARPNWRRAWA